jgi:hypothetical protein
MRRLYVSDQDEDVPITDVAAQEIRERSSQVPVV